LRDKSFPALYWHPETGEAAVYNSAAEVPTGHLDHHPKHFDGLNPPPPARDPDVIPMTREEIVAVLKESEIKFAANAGIKSLYSLLVSSVKEHLTAEGIEFPETATGPELLELVPKQE
jgi:hypothetical protein